jgi:hypothetical protein
VVQEIAQINAWLIANDLAKLIYEFTLLTNKIHYVPTENIQLIYKIHGFNNY